MLMEGTVTTWLTSMLPGDGGHLQVGHSPFNEVQSNLYELQKQERRYTPKNCKSASSLKVSAGVVWRSNLLVLVLLED